MSKEFDPDEFLEKTAPIAEMQTQQAPAQAQAAPQPGAVPGQGPVAPGMLEQAGNFMTQTAIPTAYGVGAAAADVAASHPYMTAGAAAMLPNNILNKIPGGQKIAAGKEFFNNLGNAAQAYAQKEARLQNRPGFGGMGPGANPGATAGINPGATAGAPTGAPVSQQPSMLQRGMDMASKMRQFAAQRVMPMAAGAAVPTAVAGAVAAPGAAMMMDAYRNYQTQTPEQRKQSAMEALSGQGMGQAGIY